MPPHRLSSSKFVRRRAALFGFDNAHRHKAIHQLRELLKLNKVQFQDMKQIFEKITRKHLDIDKTGSSQYQALDKALEDLQSQLPALFKKGNIEQRLSFATRVILVNHGRHRKQHTSRIVKNKPNVRPSLAERMAANLASITNGTRAPRIFASPAPALRKVPPSSSSSVKIESPLPEIPASASRSPRARREHSSALPAQTSNPNVNVRTPSSSISGPGSSNAQFSLPFLARHDSSHIAESEAIKVETPSSRTPSISSRNMLAGSSTFTSCRDEQARGCQICRVHKFLDAAIPSMTHLLHQFIEFGCLGEDFLFAVSTWSPEVIRIFLRSLPPGPGGHALTKMEVEILTYHFESYFLVSNSKA